MQPSLFEKWRIPLLPGWRFWEDRFTYNRWRIQENLKPTDDTKRFRLLDPRNKIWATGRSYKICKGSFDGLKAADCNSRQDPCIKRNSKKGILIVHGLDSPLFIFKPLASALRKVGFDVEVIQYSTNRGNLKQHGDKIESIINRMEDLDELHFIGHSLGCLVLREALSRDSDWKQRMKFGKLLLIGGPNKGASMANKISHMFPRLFKFGSGKIGEDLKLEAARDIPVPKEFDIGVIGGSMGPLLPHHDGLVAVKETRMKEAKDYMKVVVDHITMLFWPRLIRASIHFMHHGDFGPDSDLKKANAPKARAPSKKNKLSL